MVLPSGEICGSLAASRLKMSAPVSMRVGPVAGPAMPGVVRTGITNRAASSTAIGRIGMDGYLGVGAQTNAQHGVERCAAQVAAFRVQRFRLARHLAASFPTFRPFDLFDFIPDPVAASRVNDAF